MFSNFSIWILLYFLVWPVYLSAFNNYKLNLAYFPYIAIVNLKTRFYIWYSNILLHSLSTNKLLLLKQKGFPQTRLLPSILKCYFNFEGCVAVKCFIVVFPSAVPSGFYGNTQRFRKFTEYKFIFHLFYTTRSPYKIKP